MIGTDQGTALVETKVNYADAKRLRVYDKAIELEPKYADAWNKRGLAFQSRSKFDEAIQFFDKAIEIDPQNASDWNNKGTVFPGTGELQ